MAPTDSKPRPGGEANDRPPPPSPWRVEGLPPGQDGNRSTPPPTPPRMPRGRFIAIIIALTLLNIIVYQALRGPASPSRVTVDYTFFRQQVDAAERLGGQLQGRRDRRHA